MSEPLTKGYTLDRPAYVDACMVFLATENPNPGVFGILISESRRSLQSIADYLGYGVVGGEEVISLWELGLKVPDIGLQKQIVTWLMAANDIPPEEKREA